MVFMNNYKKDDGCEKISRSSSFLGVKEIQCCCLGGLFRFIKGGITEYFIVMFILRKINMAIRPDYVV